MTTLASRTNFGLVLGIAEGTHRQKTKCIDRLSANTLSPAAGQTEPACSQFQAVKHFLPTLLSLHSAR